MYKIALFSMPVVSALFLAVSLLPYDLGFIAWFGLAPLLFTLRRVGPRSGIACAFGFAFLFSIGSFGWAGKTAEIGFLRFLLLIAPPISIYYLVFGLLYRLLSRRFGSWMILGAPALWVALEYTRSHLFFLSLPWNILAHSQYLYPQVIQIADVVGEYGISFVIVMANQFLSEMPDYRAVQKKRSSITTIGKMSIPNWRASLLTLAITFGTVFSYSLYKLSTPENNEHLRVAVIQPNVLTRDDMSFAEQKEHLTRYVQLSKKAAKQAPDLIVWPASSLPAPIKTSRLVRLTILQLVHQTKTYLVVGGAGRDKFSAPTEAAFLPYSNTEYLISPTGRIEGEYGKMVLVPFNEYLPLQGTITWPRWITPIVKGYKPGEQHALFQVNGAKFGTTICWESMFPDFFRQFVKKGARFMVCATNEGFYGRTAAPYQTLATSVFRAVENRVAIARAAPTGISAIINPNGKIIDRVRDKNGEDLFIAGILIGNMPLSAERTFYTVYGDIFAWTSISITILMIAIALYSKKWNKNLGRPCDGIGKDG